MLLKGTLNTTPYPNLEAKWLRVLALSVVDSRFDLLTSHIKDISAKDNQGDINTLNWIFIVLAH
jgi:hypothetical protein